MLCVRTHQVLERDRLLPADDPVQALLGRFRAESRGPDRAVIGTKLAVYPTRLTAQSFEDACRASLARMERDQIELVQAHWSAKNFQPW